MREMALAIVWFNVIIYTYVVVSGSYDVYFVLTKNLLPEDASAVLIDVIGIRLLLIFPSLVCIYGLVRRKAWGCRAAFACDLALGLLLGVIPFFAAALAAHLAHGNVGDFLPSGMASLTVLSAVAFFSLAAALRTAPVRELFRAHA